MFSDITNGLINIFNKYINKKVLTDQQLALTIDNIRSTLLDAEIVSEVVNQICKLIESKGKEFLNKTLPDNATADRLVTTLVRDALTEILSDTRSIQYKKDNNKIMLIGSIGSGKTTTVGKLANIIKKDGTVATVSLDLRRSGASEQLKIVSEQSGATYFDKEAQISGYKFIIYDTPGIKFSDEKDLDGLSKLIKSINPNYILLVCDSLMGSEAIASVKNLKFKLSGIIITKLDGNPKGGTVISVKSLCDSPIIYICDGEKTDDIREFDPSGMASSIIGLGDIKALSEKIEKLAKEPLDLSKIQSGKMTMEDFKSQISLMNSIGISKLGKMIGLDTMMAMKKIPGLDQGAGEIIEKKMQDYMIMINSMTKKERQNPDIIYASYKRKQRIAKGSGKKNGQVEELMKHYYQIANAVKDNSGYISRLFGK